MSVNDINKVEKGSIIKSETINTLIDGVLDVQSQVTYNFNTNSAEHTAFQESMQNDKDQIFELINTTKTQLSEQAQIPIADLTTRVEALEEAIEELKASKA